MGDNRTDLPEGTDTIIEGASNPDETPALPQGSGAEAQSGAVTVGQEGGANPETARASSTRRTRS